MLKRNRSGGQEKIGLSARLPVPVTGAWERLPAGKKRLDMLQQAFSTEAVQKGEVFVILGPRGAGKSAAALAISDLRGLQAIYATAQKERPALAPAAGQCIIVDPVSAFDPEGVRSLIDEYAGIASVVLVDRTERAMRSVFGDLQTAADAGDVTLLHLRMPSKKVIADYIQTLLDGYDADLTSQDFLELGEAMQGMSLPHVNQVSVDAALSRLQYAQTIDRSAFDQALTNWNRLRGSEQDVR